MDRRTMSRRGRLNGDSLERKESDDGWGNTSFVPAASNPDQRQRLKKRVTRSSSQSSNRSTRSNNSRSSRSNSRSGRNSNCSSQNSSGREISLRAASPRFKSALKKKERSASTKSNRRRELVRTKDPNKNVVIDSKYKSPTSRRRTSIPKSVKFSSPNRSSASKRAYSNRRGTVCKEYTPHPSRRANSVFAEEDAASLRSSNAESDAPSTAESYAPSTAESYAPNPRKESRGSFTNTNDNTETVKARVNILHKQFEEEKAKNRPDFEVWQDSDSENEDWGGPTATGVTKNPQDLARGSGNLPIGISARWQLSHPGWEDGRYRFDPKQPSLDRNGRPIRQIIDDNDPRPRRPRFDPRNANEAQHPDDVPRQPGLYLRFPNKAIITRQNTSRRGY